MWLSLLPLALISLYIPLYIAVFQSPGPVYSVGLMTLDVLLAGWVYARLRKRAVSDR